MTTLESTRTIVGIVVGLVVSVDKEGIASITFSGIDRTIPARATVSLSKDNVGAEVALMFEGGNPEKPIIMGLIVDPSEGADEPMEVPVLTASGAARSAVEVDGEAVDYAYLEGKEMVVLRCGRASITMTKEGKVIIRGAYISSRSSGVNRMKGGSIQLN